MSKLIVLPSYHKKMILKDIITWNSNYNVNNGYRFVHLVHALIDIETLKKNFSKHIKNAKIFKIFKLWEKEDL